MIDYEKAWKLLKNFIIKRAKTPTPNSRTTIKHAEELARKQSYLDIMTQMDELETTCNKPDSKDEDKYKL